MIEFAERVLGLTASLRDEGMALFHLEDGSLFEVFAPDTPAGGHPENGVVAGPPPPAPAPAPAPAAGPGRPRARQVSPPPRPLGGVPPPPALASAANRPARGAGERGRGQRR